MSKNKLDLPMRGVVKRYLRGYSTHKLARLYGCQAGTIARRLRQKGCALRPYHGAVSVEDVRALHALGYSHERMAQLLGTSSSTVARRLAAAGLPSWGHSSRRRDTGYTPPPTRRVIAIEDAVALRAQGHTHEQIADALGSSSSTIGRMLIKAGIRGRQRHLPGP